MKKKAQMVEAVLFFRDNGICKEMLYPEFEAVLDGVVNLPEFAGEQMPAAYVLIDPRLMIRSAVFFYLDFQDNGAADTGWNIPLRNLADRGGRGPDLGAGPIRLVCRSQCPVAWHQMHLWDPEFSGKDNLLVKMRDRIKRNALGLLVEEEQPQMLPADRLQVAAEERWYPPNNLFDVPQQSFIEQPSSSMMGVPEYMEQKLRDQAEESERVKATLQAEIEQLKKTLAEEQARGKKLQSEQNTQAEGFRKIRDELSDQVKDSERKAQVGVEAMRARFEQEAQARINAVVEDYQRRVESAKAETATRDGEIAKREAEIAQLKGRCETLLENSGEKVLGELAGLGMVFVVYHPGAGQLTVPLEDVAVYKRDPLAYAAARCSVTPELYQQWLEHYMRPNCDAKMLNGDRCNIPIDRVDLPARFSPGVSNCCSRHQAERGKLRTGS